MNYDNTPASEKSVRDYVRGYMLPKIRVMIDNISKHVKAIVGRVLRLRSGMISDTTLQTADNVTAINTIVPGDGHTHSTKDIEGSTLPVIDGIVKRDANGKIIGAGSSYGNTGYKLANGADISTLFKAKSDTASMTALNGLSAENNITEGTAGSFVTNLAFSSAVGSGGTTSLVLNRTFGTLCPRPDITTDGCK